MVGRNKKIDIFFLEQPFFFDTKKTAGKKAGVYCLYPTFKDQE